MLPDLEKASSCATQDKNVSNLTPRYFSGLADCFHDTTEYPGLPASGGQFLRAVQRYHFARLFAHGKRVLEVACGAGLGLGYLAHDASEVVGGDIDRLNLATAAATYAGAEKINIIGMDAHSMPFLDASFDLVVLNEALYYLTQPDRFIQEAARVLGPGGTLVVVAVNGEWKNLHRSPHAVRYYSARAMSDLATPCFSHIELYGSAPLGTGLGTEMLSLVKNLAVRLDMIPQTLASRAGLKRALFGKMKTMPAVITETMAPYMAPMQIEGDGPNPQFSILFMVAKRNCLRSPVSEVCSRKVALSEAKRATTIEGVSSRPMRNMAELNFFRGRVALYGMLKALGVKRGDEVAMAAYTCVAVPEAVIALGARPVWIDLGPDALTMDPDHAEVVLKSSTRALIVQHTFGVAAQMERLVEIAARRGVPIIEDCCHTHRSTSRGQAVGSFGAGAFYSFEWGKPLVAGLGGAAVCHDPEMNRELVSLYSEFREVPLIRELRIALQYYAYQFGYRPSLYWVARRLNRLAIQLGLGEEGYHSLGDLEPSRDFLYRMARISRARLVHRINEIDAIAAYSDWVCANYREGIQNPEVQPHPPAASDDRIAYARFPLWVSDKRRLLADAEKAKIEITGWYETPVHPLDSSALDQVGYRAGSCPNAERAARDVVTLPVSRKCTSDSIERTITAINRIRL